MKNKSDANPSSGNDIYAVLGVIESLDHCDEGRSSVSFFINARQVVMHLDYTLEKKKELLQLSLKDEG